MVLAEKPMTPTFALVVPITPCCRSAVPSTLATLEVLGTCGPFPPEIAYADAIFSDGENGGVAVDGMRLDADPVARPSDYARPVGRGAEDAGIEPVRNRRLILTNRALV